MQSLSPRARQFQRLIEDLGFHFEVRELADSTRSAAEAAAAVGCQLGQIAKSLIFRGKRSGRPILVIASGANRVDEIKLGFIVGEEIEKADADFVRQATGFAIGGVPPFGHQQKLATYIDKDLLDHQEIWAAAGTPHAVFKLTPTDLIKVTQGQIIKVK